MEEKRMSIYETKDYSIFKSYGHNRDVDQRSVKKLMVSISESGLIQPLVVSSDMKIVDGQHRLSACIQLNIPVWYVVNNFMTSDAIIEANNTQSAWKRGDWIHSWANKNNPHYLRLTKLIADNPNFTENIICEIFNADKIKTLTLIKSGEYRVDERFGSTMLLYCTKMTGTHLGQKAYGTKFVRALMKVYSENKNMSIDNLVRKTKFNKIITTYSNEMDIVDDIIQCYNYRLNQAKKINYKLRK